MGVAVIRGENLKWRLVISAMRRLAIGSTWLWLVLFNRSAKRLRQNKQNKQNKFGSFCPKNLNEPKWGSQLAKPSETLFELSGIPQRMRDHRVHSEVASSIATE